MSINYFSRKKGCI